MDRGKLEKLYTLSIQGIGGEATNSRELLLKLLEKEGIDYDLYVRDLDRDNTSWKLFNVSRGYKLSLFWHIVFVVLDQHSVSYRKVPKSTTKFLLNVTQLQYVLINNQYALYTRDWDKQIDEMYYAYIIANHLQGPKNPNPSKKSVEVDLESILNKASSINKLDINTPLTYSQTSSD